MARTSRADNGGVLSCPVVVAFWNQAQTQLSQAHPRIKKKVLCAGFPISTASAPSRASARTGSFAGAAKELNVTPAAISRMVRLLEAAARGRPCSCARPIGWRSTPAGRSYQAGLTQIFDALANLTDQVKTLSASPSADRRRRADLCDPLADPAAGGIQARIAPEVDVRITTGGAAAPFSDDWTCGIKLGGGDWPGLVAEPLLAAVSHAGLCPRRLRCGSITGENRAERRRRCCAWRTRRRIGRNG